MGHVTSLTDERRARFERAMADRVILQADLYRVPVASLNHGQAIILMRVLEGPHANEVLNVLYGPAE